MPLTRDKVLLVEGRDDREVVYQFCNHHHIDNQSMFSVEAKDGIESLLADLGLRPRTGISVLGVVVDADVDPGARWQQIEDFLLRLAQEEDRLLERARSAVGEIPAADRRFAAIHHSKATAHTWLAWQEEPGTALGQAITKRYLDPSRDPAPAFRDWLLELFG